MNLTKMDFAVFTWDILFSLFRIKCSSTIMTNKNTKIKYNTITHAHTDTQNYPHIFQSRCFTLSCHLEFVPSVFRRCWLGSRKGIRPVKTERWGAGMVICLERDADLHMAQLMPLPLTVSCFSKIQIGFTFLVPAHLGSPGKRAVKSVCVCVCVCVCLCLCVPSTVLVQNCWRIE